MSLIRVIAATSVFARDSKMPAGRTPPTLEHEQHWAAVARSRHPGPRPCAIQHELPVVRCTRQRTRFTAHCKTGGANRLGT